MDEKVKLWWEKANKDIEVAKHDFKGRFYDSASFNCQQAVEKALKALILKKGKIFRKTHDLLYLSRIVEAPSQVIEACKEISPVYMETRYPDTTGIFTEYSKEETEEDIKNAERVLRWVKEQMA